MIKFIKGLSVEERVLSVLAAVVLFWIFFLNHTEPFNVGITNNSLNGKIGFQTNSGWHITHPFIRVSEVTCRPGRVSLSGSGEGGSSSLDDKIVKFVMTAEALTEFVKIEGFHYVYTHRTLTPYAFSGNKFPFLEIVREYHKSSDTISK